jgi:cation transport regulator ChaB
MQVVNKVLREMAEEGKELTFSAFKYQLNSQNFAKGQSGPLNMRLRLLESFLDIDHDDFFSPWAPRRSNTNREKTTGNVAWEFKKGTLTIIDLSCPFVDENDACALFNICLGIFLERRDKGGRIIALDEAHKVCSTYPWVLPYSTLAGCRC